MNDNAIFTDETSDNVVDVFYGLCIFLVAGFLSDNDPTFDACLLIFEPPN